MAMNSIKFHAAMRDKYPVYGCLVEIQQLSYRIQMAEEELQAVLQQLAYYKQQQHQQQYQHEVSATTEYLSELQLGMAPPGNTAMSLVHEDNPTQYNGVTELPIISSYANSGINADYSLNYFDFKESNVVDSFCQQTYNNSDNNNMDPMVVNSQSIIPQTMSVRQDITTQDYNEMHPFFDHIDDTQSYVGSKEAYESSFESPLKDSGELVEEMDENELKSAAACFSLTSVN
ncbi:hypothetical protein DH2020_040757 [Rehmannia glutinosa]|uniref:LOB domain-containing protein n=1 Tax=Rehmannia glutinosa TaxID=99300 RepID=A0ABR0UTE5_REHGL